jgi:Thioesterase-like superfamily
MPAPLFQRDGDRFVPGEDTRGPWDSRAQHAGPPAALLARALEALPSEVPMLVTRFSMDILRPVPLTPLTVSARVERPGRRVQLLHAVLRSDDVELCRVSAWRIRRLDTPMRLPARLLQEALSVPAPEQGIPPDLAGAPPAFHSTGVAMRFVAGSFSGAGPSTVWIRLLHPVVDDEPPSPLMRVVAAADFGNGVSAELNWHESLFINCELTVHVQRDLAGEWVGLDARTFLDPHGAGFAESAIHDVQGRLGRSVQSLLVQPAREETA